MSYADLLFTVEDEPEPPPAPPPNLSLNFGNPAGIQGAPDEEFGMPDMPAPLSLNIETEASLEVVGDGKRKRKPDPVPGAASLGATFHCNYCGKDISQAVRIKCSSCLDFDLCINCFSVGAELHPHKNNHPYRVVEVQKYPVYCDSWTADEEERLLEAMEIYGYGNWNTISEHLGTKKSTVAKVRWLPCERRACWACVFVCDQPAAESSARAVRPQAHYYQVYLDGSRFAPLPETNRVIAMDDGASATAVLAPGAGRRGELPFSGR